MTTTPFIDIAERFPLGAPNGFMPTAEPVSDTATTPFGLTLRTAPTPVSPSMVTEKVTTPSTDGNGKDADFDYDVATDIG